MLRYLILNGMLRSGLERGAVGSFVFPGDLAAVFGIRRVSHVRPFPVTKYFSFIYYATLLSLHCSLHCFGFSHALITLTTLHTGGELIHDDNFLRLRIF